jgi:glucan phosphoethanolaminetransferase (alkaline phosphatase superfamily)
MVPNVIDLFVVTHAVPQRSWNFSQKKRGQSDDNLVDILSRAGLPTTLISVYTDSQTICTLAGHFMSSSNNKEKELWTS